MNKHLEQLKPHFRDKVIAVIEACRARGIELVPYFGSRSLLVQASKWRQGRSLLTIEKKIASLIKEGAVTVASLLKEAGVNKDTNIVTQALPGQSGHQYGLACDLYWEKSKGIACWNGEEVNSEGLNGYKVMREEADKLGLVYVDLKSGPDYCHLQDSEFVTPKNYAELEEKVKSLV